MCMGSEEGHPFPDMVLRTSCSINFPEYALDSDGCSSEVWGWAKHKSQLRKAVATLQRQRGKGGCGAKAASTHLELGDKRISPPLVSSVQGTKRPNTSQLSLDSGVQP